MRSEKLFSLPSAEMMAAFVKWLSAVLAAFFVIYYSCNAYAALQADHYHMYAEWELSIPLIPPMIIIYLGYVGIFGVVPFIFKTPDAIRALGHSLLVIIAVSGVVFVLFPGHLGYHRTDDIPTYGFLFRLLHAIDQPHNLFPSMHVSFAYMCAMTMIHQARQRWFHALMHIWFLILCSSVILVHQHHFFDVGIAIILGWVVYNKVYLASFTKGTGLDWVKQLMRSKATRGTDHNRV